MFLVIALILVGIWNLLGRQLHKPLIWCGGSAMRPIKSIGKTAGTLRVRLHHFAFRSISLTSDKSMIVSSLGHQLTIFRAIFCANASLITVSLGALEGGL